MQYRREKFCWLFILICCVLGISVTIGCQSSSTSKDNSVNGLTVTRSFPAESRVVLPTTNILNETFSARALPPTAQPRNVLLLSAGGQYAAFHAGLLVGWSKNGTRPRFDIVTGVSSGAIVAGYAFLGEKYDGELQTFYTTVANRDIFRYRPVSQLIRNGSLASSKRLIELIKVKAHDQFIADLRQAHCEGRRLYITTMNSRTRRLYVWDLGAIACSGRPDANDLVRRVYLAAVSIPGLLPPVEFEFEINGVRVTEEHSDAGPAAQTFIRLSDMLKAPSESPGQWLQGSNLYSLAGGKLYAPDLEGRLGFLKRLTSTISAALYALYRAELVGIHSFCQVSGMKFHMLAIPENADVPKNSTSFEPEEMRKLFSLGYTEAIDGIQWRVTPPGSRPGEEEPPLGAELLVMPQPKIR